MYKHCLRNDSGRNDYFIQTKDIKNSIYTGDIDPNDPDNFNYIYSSVGGKDAHTAVLMWDDSDFIFRFGTTVNVGEMKSQMKDYNYLKLSRGTLSYVYYGYVYIVLEYTENWIKILIRDWRRYEAILKSILRCRTVSEYFRTMQELKRILNEIHGNFLIES